MISCPKCGAINNVPGLRKGVIILQYGDMEYRGICLNCWHKTKKARTYGKALENWDEQTNSTDYYQKRKALGLSQEALAEKCGLSSDTVYRAENGLVIPTKETLEKLETGLEMR